MPLSGWRKTIDHTKGKAMPDADSRYPISRFLLKLLEETGFTRTEFVLSLGYRNVERGRRRLDPWIDEGTGFDKILRQIATAYPNHADRLQNAITNTKAVKAAERHAEFFDLCKAQESTFVPYIHVEGEDRIPNGITLFGLTGGHEVWTTIKVPQRILDLPVDQQLAALPELMHRYLHKYNGACPFFGKVIGFKFVRLLDYYQFDADTPLLGHVEEPFRTGYAEISLR
jgi:hypothetical protein